MFSVLAVPLGEDQLCVMVERGRTPCLFLPEVVRQLATEKLHILICVPLRREKRLLESSSLSALLPIRIYQRGSHCMDFCEILS